ncbi:glycosyltransferase [Capillimicrobium parvum]|uniref:D-inositol 3-phosphate glycosyltransferase n=1 Tax=Capillimicrobium parvum TaxID=2884022 RepID=A0A9E7C0M6_9ACTN|nr:glycosyltransferase [Capillimicrobium parvum]UGS35774.1 D-inositol 3-phosphate glycosyltransferase [Capillimicrobium parvum]
MRVAMISEHASPLAVLGEEDAGGQNVHVAALSIALARLGCDVTVYTRRDDALLPRRVPLAAGVVVEHVDAGPARAMPKDDLLPHMDAFAEYLHAAWRDEPPDVVHGHFWMSGLAALDAAQPLGIPVAHTFHALGIVKRRHQGARDTSPADRIDLERGIVRRAHRIVATCSDEVFELLRLGAQRRRITVVPCGVDLAHFTPDGSVAPRPPGRPRVLCVARLVERKGVGNVVSALAGVPEAELVIAGGPPPAALDDSAEIARLRALAGEHGVADRVSLLGSVERADLPALLRSADVVACVPWYEPFGIVPLEAMACGIPVVASAVGGLIDTVVDGVTGVHVPPRRPDRIAAAVRSLLDDPVRRQALGRAGARRARRRYGWDRIARATLTVYRELALGRAAAVEEVQR